MKKWIILDRDGVINHDSDKYIKSPDEWIPIPGSLEAIARLNWAGYYVVVITNQSGVNRGLYTEEILDKIHEKMQAALLKAGGHIEGVFHCPHRPDEKCKCRKPKPGLLLTAAKEFDFSLENVFFIGDKLSDVKAAHAAKCKPILVKTGYGDETFAKHKDSSELVDVPVYTDLASAVAVLLGKIS